MRTLLFKDRAEAGRALAKTLSNYRNEDCVVYGLPRGGVVPAVEVAQSLGAPLDLLITRKLSHPDNKEYAIGAVSDEGDVVLSPEAARVYPELLEFERTQKLREAQDRRVKYLGGRPKVNVEGRTAIVVDDGIATGYTMKAALIALKKRKPARIVVAAPVGPMDVVDEMSGYADEVIVPNTPEDFYAIGAYYLDFAPVEDEAVIAAMKEAARA